MSPRPVAAAALVDELTAHAGGTPGSMPAAGLAERACLAWRSAFDGGASAIERRRHATAAVVDAVYPRGSVAGRQAGAEVVADHIAGAARAMAARLDEDTDPGRTVRALLDRLTAATQDEAVGSRRPGPGVTGDTPMPRTYLAALGGGRGGSDLERVATATVVAWRHGYEDGWTEGYWSANRIVNTIRHDELAATTAVAGTPTLAWLDRLAESAREIATDRPRNDPARLARLAGPSTPARAHGPHEQARPGGQPVPTRRINHTDNSHRRPRRM